MKKKDKIKGIATLFDQFEIKSFLKNYLIFIGIVEAVIFFVCFVEKLGSPPSQFPWKNYFFSAFIVPVVITFLLGVLVAGFNKYIYGSYYNNNEDTDKDIIASDDKPGYIKKLEILIMLFQRLPFLLTLFILTITAGIIYKLDSIIAFITAAGQKSFKYIFIVLGIILGMVGFFTIIWLILNYRLKKKAIEYNHSYRESIIKKLGVIIMDDGTLIDQKGRILSSADKKTRPAKKQDSNLIEKTINITDNKKNDD